MKKNIISEILLVVASFFLLINVSNAQQKKNITKKSFVVKSNPDSLLREIDNTIYNTYYNSDYWKKSIIPIFTILKIDVDKKGEIKSIGFSDSADSLFVSEFLNKPSYPATRSTLEKYARAKSYKDISILIPVSYEPNYNPKRGIDYKHAESLWKFNKKEFTGNMILLSPIAIKVLSKGEM